MIGSGDYISREAANEACREAVRRYPNSFYNGIEAARDAIRKLPAADVRPVVLCKDCMYAPSGTDGGEDQGFALEWPHDEWPEDNPCPCKCDDGWYSHKPKPDFFCANGKREEN